MNAGLSVAELHDSEVGDIYALYNACDGVMVDGLLDVRKLEEYNPEDAKALNVPRLKEVWQHTKSGCAMCESVIQALTDLRESIKVIV